LLQIVFFVDRRKLKVRRSLEASVGDSGVVEVRHDTPVSAWRNLWRGGPVMMDAHTLEAGQCAVALRPLHDKKGGGGGGGWVASADESRLFGVAAGMLDLKSGGSRCLAVTLLPPGPRFLTLALLAFGKAPPPGLVKESGLSRADLDAVEAWSDACEALGESLVFQPFLTRALLAFFGHDLGDGKGDNGDDIDALGALGHGSPVSRGLELRVGGGGRSEHAIGTGLLARSLEAPASQLAHQLSNQRGTQPGHKGSVTGGVTGGVATGPGADLPPGWSAVAMEDLEGAFASHYYWNEETDEVTWERPVWPVPVSKPVAKPAPKPASKPAAKAVAKPAEKKTGAPAVDGDDEEFLLQPAQSRVAAVGGGARPGHREQRERPTKTLKAKAAAKKAVAVAPASEASDESDEWEDEYSNDGDDNGAGGDAHTDQELEWDGDERDGELVDEFFIACAGKHDDSGDEADNFVSDNSDEVLEASIEPVALLGGAEDNDADVARLGKAFATDKKLALAAIAKNETALGVVSEELKADKKTVLAAVTRNGQALKFASATLQADKHVVLAAVAQNGNALEFASDVLKADKEVVLAAVNQNRHALVFAAVELKDDKKVMLTAIAHGCSLAFASKRLRANKKVVLAAVSRNGRQLANVLTAHKSNKEIVLAAVTNDGTALKYASAALQADKEVVFAASSTGLQHASKKLKADKKTVLAAVTRNGQALKFASATLQADKHVVLTAVAQNGNALEFASDVLKADKEVVLAAVNQNGNALEHASLECANDKDIVLKALVSSDGAAVAFAGPDLGADATFAALAAALQASAQPAPAAQVAVVAASEPAATSAPTSKQKAVRPAGNAAAKAAAMPAAIQAADDDLQAAQSERGGAVSAAAEASLPWECSACGVASATGGEDAAAAHIRTEVHREETRRLAEAARVERYGDCLECASLEEHNRTCEEAFPCALCGDPDLLSRRCLDEHCLVMHASGVRLADVREEQNAEKWGPKTRRSKPRRKRVDEVDLSSGSAAGSMMGSAAAEDSKSGMPAAADPAAGPAAGPGAGPAAGPGAGWRKADGGAAADGWQEHGPTPDSGAPLPIANGGAAADGGAAAAAGARSRCRPNGRQRRKFALSEQLRASVTAFAAAHPDDLAARSALITLEPRLRDAVDRLLAGASLAETTLALVSDAAAAEDPSGVRAMSYVHKPVSAHTGAAHTKGPMVQALGNVGDDDDAGSGDDKGVSDDGSYASSADDDDNDAADDGIVVYNQFASLTRNGDSSDSGKSE